MRVQKATVLLVVWCAVCGCDNEEAVVSVMHSPLATDVANSGVDVVIDSHGQVTSTRIRQLVPEKGLAAPAEKPVAATISAPAAPAAPGKIHGNLRALMNAARNTDVIDVSVGVKDVARFSGLPALDPTLPRNSAKNMDIMAARLAAFEAMAAPRRKVLARWADKVRAKGGEVLEEHVIGSSLTTRMSVASIQSLSDDPDLEYLGPRFGELPPADSNSSNDTIKARAKVATDPYVAAGYAGNTSFMALLDTGVRTSHVMLQVPSPIDVQEDCYRGGPNCNDQSQPGFSTTDTYNHGTQSAAIISGTVNLGSNWRGVTSFQTIDNFKVSQDNGGTDEAAVLKAYHRAYTWGDWAVAAVIQMTDSPTQPISTGANELYDLGIAVFAGNGNFPGNNARSPANATKVIGVGGYDLVSGSNYNGNVGTSDGRFKPDLRMPTGIETASAKTTGGAFCDSCMKVYGGTSCATPVAAATASILRNYFVLNSLPYVPGNIYAGMIAFGNETPNATNGSGRTKLAGPTCNRFSVGQVSLDSNTHTDLTFAIGSGESNLKAAIWWPETVGGGHGDIDLYAIRPNGTFVSSFTVPSVFERVQVDGALQTGTWTIRMIALNVPFGPRQVFYVVYNKAC